MIAAIADDRIKVKWLSFQILNLNKMTEIISDSSIVASVKV